MVEITCDSISSGSGWERSRLVRTEIFPRFLHVMSSILNLETFLSWQSSISSNNETRKLLPQSSKQSRGLSYHSRLPASDCYSIQCGNSQRRQSTAQTHQSRAENGEGQSFQTYQRAESCSSEFCCDSARGTTVKEGAEEGERDSVRGTEGGGEKE